MSEPNVNLWKEAIEKLEKEERERAQEELRAKIVQKQAQAQARFVAAVVELDQFLSNEEGAYAKKLLKRKNVFLVLDMDSEEIEEEGDYDDTRINWHVYNLDAGGLSHDLCRRSSNQDGLANGEFVMRGVIDWFNRIPVLASVVVGAMSRRMPAEQIMGFIRGRIDELARQILER